MLQQARKGAGHVRVLEVAGDALLLPVSEPGGFRSVTPINLDWKRLGNFLGTPLAGFRKCAFGGFAERRFFCWLVRHD